MHFTLIGHISTGSQFTGQGPPHASRQVWEVAEGLSSLQSLPTVICPRRVGGARLLASPLGARAQRHPFARFLQRTVGKGGPRTGSQG
jgi:hypothetical protein